LIAAENRHENICEFSHLRDLRDEIPCATEQGINSTTTGNLIRANRELIRANRELAQIDPPATVKRLFRYPQSRARPSAAQCERNAANGDALFRRRTDFPEHGAHLTTEAAQDGNQSNRNKCGDESVFDRSRGSFVAKEFFAFGSHVHLLFLALSNPRGRLLRFAAFWTKISNLCLTPALKARLFVGRRSLR
jgi:hypothetical protein